MINGLKLGFFLADPGISESKIFFGRAQYGTPWDPGALGPWDRASWDPRDTGTLGHWDPGTLGPGQLGPQGPWDPGSRAGLETTTYGVKK